MERRATGWVVRANRLLLLAALLAGPLVAVPASGAAAPSSQPIRFLARAFGSAVEIATDGVTPEVAGAAFAKAAAELAALEKLADPVDPESELARLNAGAGEPPRPADPRLLRLLERAQGFCVWSEGAHGALGAELYALWGLRGGAAGAPTAESLGKAVAKAACANTVIDPAKGTVSLALGARIEPWGFLEGMAVDRVAEILLASGCTGFLVRIGSVWRAAGKGPEGRGWPIDLPRLPGTSESAGRVTLRDRSLALVAPQPAAKGGGAGAGFSGYLNQRTGRPPEGVVAAAALTELALDAEGLAVSLYLMGPREGQLRAGSLTPKPSASWWMGSGEGSPLQVHYRWSEGQLP